MAGENWTVYSVNSQTTREFARCYNFVYKSLKSQLNITHNHGWGNTIALNERPSVLAENKQNNVLTLRPKDTSL